MGLKISGVTATLGFPGPGNSTLAKHLSLSAPGIRATTLTPKLKKPKLLACLLNAMRPNRVMSFKRQLILGITA